LTNGLQAQKIEKIRKEIENNNDPKPELNINRKSAQKFIE
jgi:hypothetical protein